MSLVKGAEQILHVVAYFMGNHISIGEITACSYRLLHLLEKIEIYIYRLVSRTIERAYLGSGITTSRLYRT